MAVAEPHLEPPLSRPFFGKRRQGAVQRALAGTTAGAWIAFSCVGLIVVVTAFAGTLAPYDPTVPSGEPLTAPSGSHLLGTDEIGRDVFSRVLVGMQSSWWGALLVIAGGIVFGGLIGLVAGAKGGWLDNALMRITDTFMALPGAVLAVAVTAALGPSYTHTLIAISIVWWPLYARIVRGEVHRLRESPHMEAARVAGTGRSRLALRHLMPGAVPPTIVAASLDIGALIVVLSGLSFLGLGAPAPAPELGSMSARGLPYLFQAWWVPILPAVAVLLLAMSANFGGDALRDRIKDR
jgi:peptide/nickel transport system permease protein